MTTISALSRRKHQNEYRSPNGDSSMKARIFLAAAILWPLFIFLVFDGNSPREEDRKLVSSAKSVGQNLRFNFRNIVDRVDIMGYGPTHPRVAFVIVGEDEEKLVSSVESLFRFTDMTRIFVVTVVVDGQAENNDMVKKLKRIDDGAFPHWHGLRPDIHESLKGDAQEDDDPHGRKVHVMFNTEKLGVTESRADAVEFVRILQKHHEDAGLKSQEEDLILLLMQGGAQLTARSWLEPVTQALIVPPPILSQQEDLSAVALKIANAVSFNIEGPAKRTGFDSTFTPVISDASATDINLSSGTSYPTPALNGAAVAMRLDTYLNLPLQDLSIKDPWAASLDLSLNLWLCADGIDMIKDVDITSLEEQHPAPLAPELAAHFAAAWMDDVTAKKFYNAYSKNNGDLSYLEWETFMSEARESPTFTKDLTTRCRSFSWYAEEINTDLSDFLTESAEVVTVKEEPENGAVPDKAMTQDDTPAKVEITKVEIKVKEGPDDAPKVKEVPVVAVGDQEAPFGARAAEGKEAPDEGKEAPDEGKEAPDERKEAPADETVTEGNEAIEDPAAAEAKAGVAAEGVSIPELKGSVKPSKPLCAECLRIIRKAKPLDISFVDVSGGHKEHPHMGATDENGNLGYIHNETVLRANPPPWTFDGEPLRNACLRRDNNYKMLKERVYVDFKGDEEAEKSGKKRDTIFCLVYTIDSGHPKIPKIRETWAPKCDGFMVASNLTDPSLGTVNIVHEGAEEYNNIWQKVRSMWSYIYDNYYEKYDWFHIGGDDLFLIIENLRLYLESEEIRTAANGGVYLPEGDQTMQIPLFLGRRFAYQGDMNEIFNSGGSGYTMNKAALKTLVVEGFPKYFPHMHTFSEDTMVARIFRNFGVFPYETKDEDGGERYMPFMPGHHYGYRIPSDPTQDWYAKYSINIKEGAAHCSPKSVAFHYVKDQAMYRLFALLYNKCPANTV